MDIEGLHSITDIKNQERIRALASVSVKDYDDPSYRERRGSEVLNGFRDLFAHLATSHDRSLRRKLVIILSPELKAEVEAKTEHGRTQPEYDRATSFTVQVFKHAAKTLEFVDEEHYYLGVHRDWDTVISAAQTYDMLAEAAQDSELNPGY